MKKIEKILFPSDLSAFSTAGLEYALTISKLYKAKLYILHILENSIYDSLPKGMHEMDELFSSVEENKRIEMNRYIRENLHDSLEIAQVIRFGSVNEEIIKFAQQEDIDLIVITENNKHEVFEVNRDGITEKIMKGTDVPVLKVNGSALKDQQAYVSFVDKEFQLNNFGRALFN